VRVEDNEDVDVSTCRLQISAYSQMAVSREALAPFQDELASDPGIFNVINAG